MHLHHLVVGHQHWLVATKLINVFSFICFFCLFVLWQALIIFFFAVVFVLFAGSIGPVFVSVFEPEWTRQVLSGLVP